MTLVEMLISVTLTLLILAAAVRLFDMMGSSLRDGRAAIELAGQLRNAAHLLQEDLDNITVPTLPWVDPDAGLGYLEVVEGPMDDATSFGNPDSMTGDLDDVLQFTARNCESPFVGRIQGVLNRRSDGEIEVDMTATDGKGEIVFSVIESPLAEVRWWVEYDDANDNGVRDANELYVLKRRALPVRGDIVFRSPHGGGKWSYETDNDLSVRDDREGLITNTLGDLSKRENRLQHQSTGIDVSQTTRQYPYLIHGGSPRPVVRFSDVGGHDGAEGQRISLTSIVLSDVLAFDVRVYDAQAPLNLEGPVPLVPGDPGYRMPVNPVARGAFVDLNYARDGSTVTGGVSVFSGPPAAKSQLFTFIDGTEAFTYDTWPSYYERNGIDEDGDGLIDEGTNGVDDDNANGVDDAGERETSPPYPVPLRGIEVRIRAMEYSTRQVRQVSLVADFTR